MAAPIAFACQGVSLIYHESVNENVQCHHVTKNTLIVCFFNDLTKQTASPDSDKTFTIISL